MKDKLIHIAAELKGHAPFTFLGAAIGILFMLIFRNISDVHAGIMFKIFHPAHVVLSAMVTASMFELHRKAKNFLLILVIGYIGSIGVATVSDSIIPYIGEKILIRKTGADLIAAIDKNNTIFLQSVYSLNIQEKILVSTSFNLLKVLLGFLNSRLLNFYIYHTFTAYKLIYPQLNQSTILEIPIPDNFVKTDWNKLINTVDKRTCCNEEAIPQIQAEIDSIVNSAYKLNKKECNLVNEHQTRLSFKR